MRIQTIISQRVRSLLPLRNVIARLSHKLTSIYRRQVVHHLRLALQMVLHHRPHKVGFNTCIILVLIHLKLSKTHQAACMEHLCRVLTYTNLTNHRKSHLFPTDSTASISLKINRMPVAGEVLTVTMPAMNAMCLKLIP
jgi:hypothetical protein